MGLWDKIMGEFIDVIEWTDDSNDTLVYRFERHGNEIKFGAKLTVRESQVAIFVNEGEIADVLGPGMYELETKNLPVLSTLQHWDHGFSSPFKAEVYFFNTKQFTNLKWGTRNPIMVRDPEFGAVRLRAFGSYSIRVNDARKFMTEIVGTDGHFTVDEISDQLRNLILTNFSTTIAKSAIPVLDMAGNYEQLGEYVTKKIAPSYLDYGLELTSVLVENISLPPEVEEAMDKRTSMGVLGNLDQYMKFQTAESLGKSGGNSALDMGMGFAVAQQMADSLNKAPAQVQQPQQQTAPVQQQAQTPPPLPQDEAVWHAAIDGKSSGPHTKQALKDLVAANQLERSSLVWKSGMENWQNAGDIDELDDLFANTPPPLPPLG